MKKRVFCFELNGQNVLGFDTGLNAQAFAKVKKNQFLTCPGFIVYPDGNVETWQPGGIIEQETMIIWGSAFPGENLGEIINESSRKDEALCSLRFWLKAHEALKNLPGEREMPLPCPAGAFIVSQAASLSCAIPPGTVFFPPAALLKRCLEGTSLAEPWMHPDLEGGEAVSFSAGVMLYRIFCGALPFEAEGGDELRRDIREGVFTPPALAAPGLDPDMASLIERVMGRIGQSGTDNPRPAPGFIGGFIGTAQRPVSSWVRPLGAQELLRFRAEREQYSKKKAFSVKSRRFMRRNTVIIAGSVIAFIIVLFSVRGITRHIAELPGTRGMSPIEVVSAYYAAFAALDHAMMSASVSGRAGRWDIELARNLFAAGRMRQVFEQTQENFIAVQEWLEAGRPATDRIVFGITDLRITAISLGETSAIFKAEYILWVPGAFFLTEGEAPSGGEMPPPGALAFRDRLELVFRRGAWRITEIYRMATEHE